MTRFERIQDELATSYCRFFCADKCKATPKDDRCYCTEAAIIGAATVATMMSSGYVSRVKANGSIKKT